MCRGWRSLTSSFFRNTFYIQVCNITDFTIPLSPSVLLGWMECLYVISSFRIPTKILFFCSGGATFSPNVLSFIKVPYFKLLSLNHTQAAAFRMSTHLQTASSRSDYREHLIRINPPTNAAANTLSGERNAARGCNHPVVGGLFAEQAR